MNDAARRLHDVLTAACNPFRVAAAARLYRARSRARAPAARQSVFGDPCGDFRARAESVRRLMHDDAASGFFDRSENGIYIIGPERGKVDHFGGDAFGGQHRGGSQRFLHHRAPADKRNVAAFAQDESDVERKSLAIVLHLSLPAR